MSTDLSALLPPVVPALSGPSGAAIGMRPARGGRVVRGPRREVISRCCNRRAAGVTVLIASLAAAAVRFCLYRARVLRRPRPARAALIHPEGTDR